MILYVIKFKMNNSYDKKLLVESRRRSFAVTRKLNKDETRAPCNLHA